MEGSGRTLQKPALVLVVIGSTAVVAGLAVAGLALGNSFVEGQKGSPLMNLIMVREKRRRKESSLSSSERARQGESGDNVSRLYADEEEAGKSGDYTTLYDDDTSDTSAKTSKGRFKRRAATSFSSTTSASKAAQKGAKDKGKNAHKKEREGEDEEDDDGNASGKGSESDDDEGDDDDDDDDDEEEEDGSRYKRRFMKSYPTQVRQRVSQTYLYVAAGQAIAVASALLCEKYIPKWGQLKVAYMSINVTLASGAGVFYLPSKMTKTRHFLWFVCHAGQGLILPPLRSFFHKPMTEVAIVNATVIESVALVLAAAPGDYFYLPGGWLAVQAGVAAGAATSQLVLEPPTKIRNEASFAVASFIGTCFLLTSSQLVKKAHGSDYDAMSSSISLFSGVLLNLYRSARDFVQSFST